MKKLLLALLLSLAPISAEAVPQNTAFVVTTCGTLPAPPGPYLVGRDAAVTVDVNGNQCTNGTFTGSVTANPPAVANAAAPVRTEAAAVPLSVDLSGSERTFLTQPLPAGTAVIGHVIVDSTPAQSVSVAHAAAPTYIEASQNPLSTDLAGNLRTSIITALPGGTNMIGHVIVDSGGGSNASVGATAAAVPGSATYFGLNKAGNLAGALADTNGYLYVNVGGGSLTANNASVGATGAAVPLSATLMGASKSGSMTALTLDASSALYADVTALPPLPTGTNVIGGVTQSGSWSVSQTGGAWSQNVIQFGGNAVVTGVGVSGLGIPRVTVASDSAVSVTQGSPPWADNVTQFGGAAVVTGVGASGAGIPRVTVSNDSNILATQSGTWTVQQGGAPWTVDITPTGSGMLTAQTAAVASSLVVKASAGSLWGVDVTPTVTGFLMIFAATAAPADGAVTPLKCWAVNANTSFTRDWRDLPLPVATGITLVYSSTGCFTKTASATAFMSAEYK